MSNQAKQLLILVGYMAMVIAIFESPVSSFIFRWSVVTVLTLIATITSLSLGERNG